MTVEPAVLLLSGGLDSATLLAELRARGVAVLAVTFDYGQRNPAELHAAEVIAAHYHTERVVVDVSVAPRGSSALLTGGPQVPTYDALPRGPVPTYVPMRNLTLVTHACAIAEARGIPRVCVGFNRDDAENYWDCTRKFVELANALLGLGGRVALEAPYVELTKVEVVARARSLGVPIERTFSCYAPDGGRPCGRCLACRVREAAMGPG